MIKEHFSKTLIEGKMQFYFKVLLRYIHVIIFISILTSRPLVVETYHTKGGHLTLIRLIYEMES